MAMFLVSAINILSIIIIQKCLYVSLHNFLIICYNDYYSYLLESAIRTVLYIYFH